MLINVGRPEMRASWKNDERKRKRERERERERERAKGGRERARARARGRGFSVYITFILKVPRVESTSRRSLVYSGDKRYNIETAWPPRCTTLRGTRIIRERGDKWAAARHNGTKEGHNKAGERRRRARL